MDIYRILRNAYCDVKTSASPALLLVLLLSAVLLAPVIPVPHSGPFLGLRVLVIQLAAISALVLLVTRSSKLGGSLKSVVSRGPGIPLLLLLLWTVLSFLLTAPTNAHGRGIAQVELLRIGTGAILYFAAVYGCRSRFHVRAMSLLLMGGAMLAAVAGIVTSSPMLLKPARGAFGEEQLMGAFLATLLPTAATFALKDLFVAKERANRIVKAIGTVIVLCALLLTAERMSWISATVGIAVAVVIALRTRMIKVPVLANNVAKVRYWSAPVLVLLALISVNIGFMCAVPVVHHRLEAVQTKVSVRSRFTLWSACAGMIRQKPLTGWGVGSFPLKAPDYISTVPTARQVEKQGVTLSSIAHNEYLQLGAELGMVGLGLYLAVLLSFFVHMVRALKHTLAGSRSWLILASIAGVASQSLNALSNPGWHFSDVNPLLWLLMGMGMAAATPRVIAKPLQTPHELRVAIKLPTRLTRWPHVAQNAAAAVVGISLVLASASVSLGKGTALSYYYYGPPPVITNVIATPNPLPAGGGTLHGQASVASGGAGVSTVYAYLYRDASYYTSLSLGSGAGLYSPSFTIPANSSAAAHTWAVQFLAYNLQGGSATASASSTQPVAGPATLYVPSAQYPTIQSGVDAAHDGDTVMVADGTYSGPGNRDIDFHGKSLIVTSQNGPAKTILDCGGYKTTDGSGNHRGFYIHSGELNATISGFTIKNGSEAYFSNLSSNGGSGIYNNNTDGTITLINCIVSGNQAGAGGILNRNTGTGTIALVNCTVSGNEDCGIDNDNLEAGTITLTNCTVTGNRTTYAGNNPIAVGGGVFNSNKVSGGTIMLTNCTISGNTAFSGGGICNAIGAGTIIIAGCVISSNAALGNNANGGGISNSVYGGAITVTNCTISGNKASNSSSGISNSNNGGTITLKNDIVFGDTNDEIMNLNGATPIVLYSDIQGGYSGTGNIDVDPLFVNSATGDLHLQVVSPCVGKGTANGATSLDKDGRTRPNPPSMGAYELTQTLTVPAQFPTIQAGITAAKSGDTVVIASGTYTGPGNVDYDFGGKGVIIKSQNGPAQTVIDCGGYPSSDGSGNHRAFYVHSGETGAVIDGFTIKNGYNAPVPGVPDSGFGGGICVDGADATILHCVFSGNTATSGGGVAILGTKHHSITITNAVFTQNTAKTGGGGYIEDTGGKVVVTGGKVSGNSADSGAGVYVKNTGGTDSFVGCLINGNKATDDGGGFHFETDSGDSTIAITNCSVSGNASPLGSDMYTDEYAGSTITLLNDIFYSSVTNDIFTHSGPVPVATYSDIRGGYLGTGNIDKDPLFDSVPNGDLHLKLGSPCLGAGTPDGAPSTDLDGNLRPNPPSMGAYELAAPTSVIDVTSGRMISDHKLAVTTKRNFGSAAYSATVTLGLKDANGNPLTLSQTLTSYDGLSNSDQSPFIFDFKKLNVRRFKKNQRFSVTAKVTIDGKEYAQDKKDMVIWLPTVLVPGIVGAANFTGNPDHPAGGDGTFPDTEIALKQKSLQFITENHCVGEPYRLFSPSPENTFVYPTLSTLAYDRDNDSFAVGAEKLTGWITRVKLYTWADKVNIVTHSKGGLVARAYLQYQGNPAILPESATMVNRLIMTVPPNTGSIEAKLDLISYAAASNGGLINLSNLYPLWKTYRVYPFQNFIIWGRPNSELASLDGNDMNLPSTVSYTIIYSDKEPTPETFTAKEFVVKNIPYVGVTVGDGVVPYYSQRGLIYDPNSSATLTTLIHPFQNVIISYLNVPGFHSAVPLFQQVSYLELPDVEAEVYAEISGGL